MPKEFYFLWACVTLVNSQQSTQNILKRDAYQQPPPNKIYGKPSGQYNQGNNNYGANPIISTGYGYKPKTEYGQQNHGNNNYGYNQIDNSDYGDKPKNNYGPPKNVNNNYGTNEIRSYGNEDSYGNEYGRNEISYGPQYGSNYGDSYGSDYGSSYGDSYGSNYGDTYGSSYGNGHQYGINAYGGNYNAGATAWPWSKPDVAPIVHLFEWKFSDIARECKEFLGPIGFRGIQISPVNEYVIIENRPWWERYQPMSYQIISRSGNESEFIEMVKACNEAEVRVYVDVVINHMSASQGNAIGTSGVSTNTDNKTYVNVPYTSDNFHPTCEINNYYNATNVRICELVGLHDLDQSQPYVRKTIINFLNKLIDIGVGGFRVDAAKHVWPEDLNYIYSKLHYLNYHQGFPFFSKPFIYQEVVDYGGEAVKGADYAYLGHVCEFRYGGFLAEAFRGIRPLNDLLNISKVAVESQWLNSSDAVVFVENHDSERSGGNTLTFKDGTNYTMAVAFLLSWDYGTPKIMSSFFFFFHDQGPPHTSNYTIADVTIDSNGSCTNGWVCQHRWRPIAAMARFRDVVSKQPVSKVWQNSNNQIAFTRGNVGFIAFNAEDTDMIENINTGMPSGTYCDIISGDIIEGKCTGLTVIVDRSGEANVTISTAGDRVVAIHALSKLRK